MAKKAAVEPEKPAKKVKKEKPKTLGTKEVASKLGIDPKAFRVYLRETGANENAEHKRYSWPLDTDFDELKEEYDAYYEKKKAARAKAEKDEKPAAKKSSKKEAPAPAKKAKKKATKPVEEEEEETEPEEEEEELD